VIEAKWDGFEDAFLRFLPAKLSDGADRDIRIVEAAE
jgi:3-methyladenine DNA glycosylase Tag